MYHTTRAALGRSCVSTGDLLRIDGGTGQALGIVAN
jgi:hypothetical protein